MSNLHPDFFSSTQKSSTRDGFGVGLKEAAQLDPNIVGLCADLTESTRMNLFKDAFPERFIELGVAEQNLIGVAAGFALSGKIPFAASYAAFSPYNSFGVLRTAVCLSNLNVKIFAGHAGLGIGEDGGSTQALEDIALMRSLPNMTVVVPCDQEEARKATRAIAKLVGPAYLRTTKFETKSITHEKSEFEIGKALTLTEGNDVMIIACGPMVEQALLANQELKEKGISARVVNIHTIKPLDSSVLVEAARSKMPILTIEDHQQAGGLGSSVAEAMSQLEIQLPLKIIGIKDSFGESGKGVELYEKYGLTANHAVETVMRMLR